MPTEPLDRRSLIRDLNGLPPQQLDELIFALNPPAIIVPPISAPHGNRTSALLQWAESNTGCGLKELQFLLYEISPRTNNENRTKIPADKLFDLLSSIDFKEQIELARNAINSHRTVAFLVQGESECGLEVLATRLIRIIKNWKKIKKKIIIQGHSRIEFVWRRLLERLEQEHQSTKQNLQNMTINKLYELWKAGDVVIILRDVDRMGVKFLSDWLEQFWEELGRKEAPEGNNKLLLLLLDIKEGEYPQNPQIPLISLPPISYFTQEMLDKWVINIQEIRSDIELPKELSESTTFLLNDPYYGIPEFVFDEICKCFGNDPERVWRQCLI